MSGTKALRATTIIPDTLYVDREADRQLDAVIEEMGRPGYILVARQMGKTNLLLRTKRRREAQGDLALYIDLSNHFDTARDLFRAIVDSLVETSENSSIRERIVTDRANVGLEANAEYDRHLRLFLTEDRHVRVIIILDEIDSLVGHPYSDRILSQIRSMYFARANHAVYNKLTYVLSGVAEPTDLIKDRNVSPFNIGEKIYLNDFSRAEAGLLLSKAGLCFAPVVIDAVFDWANGNPRMTWDICSALEDLQRAGEAVTVMSVEAIVRKLYLTRFDRAPIDHIRALAESDRQVRDALISVLYGKGDTLDDRARSKLYLAGITTASANESPQIKNKVIEFALSEAWLSQVEAGKKGLLEAASKRYKEHNNDEALALFQEFIEADGGEANLTDVHLMQLGLSYYHLSHLEEAERAFKSALSKTRSSELRNLLGFHLATTKLRLGSPQEALPLLEEVAKVSGDVQLQAKQQIGAALVAISIVENADKIIQISTTVLDALNYNKDLSDEEIAELRVISYYNLAQTYRATDRPDQARRALLSTRDAALPGQLPGLSSVLFSDGLEGEERREALIGAAKTVISERLPYSLSPAFIAFTRNDMAVLLSVALELREQALFDGLLNVATGDRPSEGFATLVDLAHTSSKPSRAAQLSNLLRFALSDETLVANGTPKLQLEAARGFYYHAKPLQREEAFKIYFDIAARSDVADHLTYDDLLLIVGRLGILVQEKRHKEALEIISFARKRADVFQSASNSLFALLIFQELNLLHDLEDEKNVKQRAREILTVLSSTRVQNDSFVTTFSSIVDELRDAAQAVLRGRPRSVERQGPRKIGRNEVVTVRDKITDLRSSNKYKRVAARIANGELELVEKSRN
jgi:tetratricopeptide (TPR) repeat protein